MTNNLRLLPILAGIALAGCASQKPTPASFPSKFAVTSGGFPGDSFSIAREGNQFVYRRFSSEPFRSQTIRLSPCDQEWQIFWAEAEAISLWKWKPSYNPRGIVNDGTRWSIFIEHEGRKISSQGENAYPSDRNPATASNKPGEKYLRFMSAIRTLIGRRDFY